ncbi:hypothetical protein NM208_g3876 [Fusarium decemcellulare]|uniref:Uncharacterized protein n=1 Tax=Fusarium decemcellulare TaxID=57161 RepID=A0ACC1SMR2_9HYPO|nr:hypothetical protein NM208_g3876 [Fusarium decemcellulare]
MALRRSARLQNRELQEPAKDQDVEQLENKKRKAPAIDAEPDSDSRKKPKASAARKANKSSDQTPLGSSSDVLTSLPPEVLDMVLINMTTKALSRLGRSSKRYHTLVSPHLYKSVSVAARFHAQIPRLIRTLEPHLTIEQREQLQSEGTYRGQEDWCSYEVDWSSIPACAGDVRQIHVGIVEPGRKHKPLVHRYVEEAFKNMDNLEMVKTRVLTKSIARTLVASRNLQALYLDLRGHEDGAMKLLRKMKNLKHLCVNDPGFCSKTLRDDNALQTILLNSRSTLRSLAIHLSPHSITFLQNWEQQALKHGVRKDQKHSLTALESFYLSGAPFDWHFVQSLDRAVDFARLRELTLGRLSRGQIFLFDYLAQLLSLPRATTESIKLRTLSVEMSAGGRRAGQNPAEISALEHTKYHFLASFNTLQSLEIWNYDDYQDPIPVVSGLSDTLLQAILKHENLTTLRISPMGPYRDTRIPFLSITTVAALIDNLPRLQEIKLAPEEDDIDELGRVLSRGLELRRIDLSPTWSRCHSRLVGERWFDLLIAILKGFMSRDNSNSTGKFKWEDHCKLRHVLVDYRIWEVASEFNNTEEEVEELEKLESGDRKREVLYRDISETYHVGIYSRHGSDLGWFERMSKDID